MIARLLRVASPFVLVAGFLAGCDEGSEPLDPTCCEDVYPVWCARYAECDPVTFSLSWSDPADCSAEQVPTCQGGHDAERLCAARTASQTDACVAALVAASCDDLFGTTPLPRACM